MCSSDLKVPTIELKDLTETQRKAYIIADNRLALNAGWDNEMLKLEFDELKELGFDLELTGFSLDEIEALNPEELNEGLTDEDEVPGIPDDPKTKVGDIYQLGNHRLMCGDSTSIDAVDKLMDGQKADMVFTDPPYGVSYTGGLQDKGAGLKGNEGVARSAEELINLAKNVGFKDDMGNVYAPNTVGAWTAVQKSLNSNWTPQNASIIRKINQAIERDIGAAGGLDLLKKADQLHQAEKVLFGSKGIKQIFGDIDPNGVQTATAFEAIPQKLNSMPVDQWKHIYETAEKVAKGTIDGPIDKATGMPKWSIAVPEELRISAQSAMNEMRGNIAREIYQAGAAKAGEIGRAHV